MLGQNSDRAVGVLCLSIALIGTLGVLTVVAPGHAQGKSGVMHPAESSPMAMPPATTTTTSARIAPAPVPSPIATPIRAPFPALQVPAETILASPIATIPTYASPGTAPEGSVGTWYDAPLVLPVTAVQSGWLQVRMPQRPNGSTAWVRAGDVTLSSTSYFIAVSLGATQLVVYQGGHPIYDFPVGVGLPATPTPLGHFFVAIREVHTDPFYGPVILDTSAHSEAIRSWEGMGDAVIAVHGPITSSADAQIGSTGARVSNGCIRLHDSDLAHLTVVPAGTLIDIVS